MSHDISGNKVLILHEQTYDLVGVLVHDGSPNSGHYFSITVCPSTGKAFLCDDLSGDEYPRLISEAMLETAVKRAFMVVYERRLNPMRKRKSETEREVEQAANKSTPEKLNEERPLHEQRQKEGKADDLSANIEEEKEGEAKLMSRPKETTDQPGEEDIPSSTTTKTATTTNSQKQPQSPEAPQEDGKDKEEQAFCALVKEYNFLRSIPPQQRTLDQRRKYTSVATKISRTKSKFPHIEVKRSAMTETEKKVAQRQKQDEKEKEKEKATAKEGMKRMRQKQDEKEKEKVKSADKERKERMRQNQDEKEKEKEKSADKERKERMRQNQDEKQKEMEKAAAKERMAKMRQNQDEKTKERARADDRQQKTAKRAGVTNKPRDGLNAELVLCGKFHVETNSLGKMDQVLNTLIIMIMKQ